MDAQFEPPEGGKLKTVRRSKRSDKGVSRAPCAFLIYLQDVSCNIVRSPMGWLGVFVPTVVPIKQRWGGLGAAQPKLRVC